MKSFNVLDLFCGAGGFSFGLDLVEKGSFYTTIGVDFNKDAIKTYNNAFPFAKSFQGDITSFELKQNIIKEAKRKKINMIIGGPPCQGFSLKGKNLGLEDKRNFLFKEFVYMVEQIQPEIFIIENVKNMISSENGFFIKEIIRLFEELNYKVSYSILNAKNFGVPQNRERTFIIGSKNKLIDINKISKSNQIVTVRDAISDLNYLNSGDGEILASYRKVKELTKYQEKMRKDNDLLQFHKSTLHSPNTLFKLSLIPSEKGKEYLPKELIGKQKFATTWGRLKWEEVSPTIDTRFDTPSNGTNTHPVLNRAITPREAARLQSFPDRFHFLGSKSAVCKQIGNAVPPLLAKAIGEFIFEYY